MGVQVITDGQVHLWQEPTTERPWPPGRSTPHRPGGFSVEQLLIEMDAAGVDRAVIVPPSWIGEDNSDGLRAAAAHPTRFAVMGRLDPSNPAVGQVMRDWLNTPGMLGVRLTFNTPQFVAWLDDGSLEEFWTQAEFLGMPVMMAAPRLAAKLAPVAERHPGVPLIMDHLALPRVVAAPLTRADFDDLLALARFPNVHAKASCMPAYSVQRYPHRDLHGHLQRVFDAFGPQRVFWGSDLTRLPGSYRQCVTLFTEALRFLTVEDREWVMGRALSEVLHWPDPLPLPA